MFYYYAVKSRNKLKRLEPEHQNVQLKQRCLFPTLDDAMEMNPDAVLVIDTQLLDGSIEPVQRRSTKSGTAGIVNGKVVFDIPIAAIRNNAPYRPPEEIKAGGGIITRKKGGRRQILTIFRRGKWDLAKGKLDPGESLEECAIREVQEELGIEKVRSKRLLATTVHGYAEKKRFRVKTTHWYHMKTSATSFIPQREEGIDKVKWMNWDKAEKDLGYKTLRELLARVKPLLKPIP